MTKVPQITVIETERSRGAYDIPFYRIIVEHPKHGRIMLKEGYGGDSIHGETYRWEHGDVFALRPDDTLESLRASEWNEMLDGLGAIEYGVDETRPSLGWKGYMIERMANRALTAPAALASGQEPDAGQTHPNLRETGIGVSGALGEEEEAGEAFFDLYIRRDESELWQLAECCLDAHTAAAELAKASVNGQAKIEPWEA